MPVGIKCARPFIRVKIKRKMGCITTLIQELLKQITALSPLSACPARRSENPD
jgi:hypothetical protein